MPETQGQYDSPPSIPSQEMSLRDGLKVAFGTVTAVVGASIALGVDLPEMINHIKGIEPLTLLNPSVSNLAIGIVSFITGSNFVRSGFKNRFRSHF